MTGLGLLEKGVGAVEDFFCYVKLYSRYLSSCCAPFKHNNKERSTKPRGLTGLEWEIRGRLKDLLKRTVYRNEIVMRLAAEARSECMR